MSGPVARPTKPVPCAGCVACCRREAIVLHPESGDRPELYETMTRRNPATGEVVTMLKQKPNGDCHYLGDDGCTIHDKAPVICREFDCRMAYLRFPRQFRKKMLRAGHFDREVFEAGRARVDTLSDADRALAISRRDKLLEQF